MDVSGGVRARARLLTAGRFSTLSLLSAKALRLYAGSGLLPPFHIDPDNGYRYYHPDQVSLGWLISLLRGADMPIAQIRAVVSSNGDQAIARINDYETSLTNRTVANRFLLVRARQHYEGNTMTTEVTTALVPDRPVLTVLRRLHVGTIDQVIASSVSELQAAAKAAGLAVDGDPFGIFHNPVDTDSDGPLEIGVPVDDLATLDGDIRSYRMSGGRVANRTVAGEQTDWPTILGFYDEICAWIDQSGYVRVGPPRETWHTLPGSAEPLKLTISWPYA